MNQSNYKESYILKDGTEVKMVTSEEFKQVEAIKRSYEDGTYKVLNLKNAQNTSNRSQPAN